MNKEKIKKIFNELCYLEGCQALYEKQDYFNYCKKCENKCRQFKIIKKINDYILKLQHQLEEKDKAIAEAIKYAKNTKAVEYGKSFDTDGKEFYINEFWFIKDILEILEKGKK